ncbi:hypothetical protein PQE68_gp135 [Bacillus phage vB_BanS_Sophrita]|uniref:Uncharacterized protein n=1 Tax=Bacillus phage vB_BanS_Sophrita TaxID=2894790 RepID=A0AAE8YVE2_9CAUD|nr:hypothetical protein PQE68_gp135 [Bacillus phage vB_BanS_Sophrita]UGO50726.1 hypothetical protein SOPHRITA_135 [Bacillus phage vB_BanS_Sophrita]
MEDVMKTYMIDIKTCGMNIIQVDSKESDIMKKMLKGLTVAVLMALAVIMAIYVGVFLMLGGGIMGIMSVITAGAGMSVLGWSLVKILFAGLAGWGTFAVFWIPAMLLLGRKKTKRL